MRKIPERVAILETEMTEIKKGQDILFNKIDGIDNKLDKICLNGAKKEVVFDIWRFIIRTASIAGITALVGLAVKIIFRL